MMAKTDTSESVRPKGFQRERIEHLRNRWIPDDSFAESVLALVESGAWSETEAVAALECLYRQAFAHGQAAQKPWVIEAVRLLKEHYGLDLERYGLQGIQRALRDKKEASTSG